MITFKEYYKNKILTESPMRIGKYHGDVMDNLAYNIEDTKMLLSKSIPINVDVDYFDYQLRCIRENIKGIIYDSFITPKPETRAQFIYIIKNGGMFIDSVWQWKASRGFAFRLLFDYYLKDYDFVVSGNKHSTQGEDFWKRIIDVGNKNGNKLSVLLTNGEEIDIDDKERFWGNAKEFYDYRIKIYKK